MNHCSFCARETGEGSVCGPMRGSQIITAICIECIELSADAIGLLEGKFDTYQKDAARTMREAPPMEALGNFGLGIAGEAGEVADYIKKVIYHGHTLDRYKLSKEIGDVLWYCAALATTLKLNLSTIAEENIEKLMERYPEGFSEEASRNRND